MSRKISFFVIGDSISIRYGPFLEKQVLDTFIYDRKGRERKDPQSPGNPEESNGGDSRKVIDYIRNSLSKLKKYDFILLNCGLHDIITDPSSEAKQVSIEEYQYNVNEIFDLFAKEGIQCIWIRTTPVNDELHNRTRRFYRYNHDVIKYNEVADQQAEKHDIQIIDLYAFTKSLGEDLQYDGVHFHENVSMLQAEFISRKLLSFNV